MGGNLDYKGSVRGARRALDLLVPKAGTVDSDLMVEPISIRDRGLRLTGVMLVCIALIVLSSCKSTPTAQMDSSVREYVNLTVGLGQRDPDSLDYFAGPESMVADTLKQPPMLTSIRFSALQLLEKIAQELPTDNQGKARKIFLLGQLQAIANRVNVVLGVPESFDQETMASFGVVVPYGYDGAAIANTQTVLRDLLPGKGSLAERYQDFDSRFIIPAKLVPAVMARAIEGCRAETMAHISLPTSEAVTLEYVGNRPWSAFSRYKGSYHSVLQVNMDFALTVDRVLNLACHEAYPGHHTYNSIRDANLVQNRGLKEYLVQPTYSPQSMLSESMATLAVDVAFPKAKRLAFERDVLFPIAGLDSKDAALYLRVEDLVDRLHVIEPEVARKYLDGKLEFERAGTELESAALMVHPEAALKYINEYRSYVTTYTYGRDLLGKQLEQQSNGDDSARWKIYAQWMIDEPQLSGAKHETGAGNTSSHVGGG